MKDVEMAFVLWKMRGNPAWTRRTSANATSAAKSSPLSCRDQSLFPDKHPRGRPFHHSRSLFRISRRPLPSGSRRWQTPRRSCCYDAVSCFLLLSLYLLVLLSGRPYSFALPSRSLSKMTWSLSTLSRVMILRQPDRNNIVGQTTFFSLYRASSAIEVTVFGTVIIWLNQAKSGSLNEQ